MLVQRGMQALMLCNGLFVSNRTLEQVYAQELMYYRMPALPPYDGRVTIDDERKTVTVGDQSNDPIPAMRAAYRDGLGCIILAPDQTLADVEKLPSLTLPNDGTDPATTPWPERRPPPRGPFARGRRCRGVGRCCRVGLRPRDVRPPVADHAEPARRP